MSIKNSFNLSHALKKFVISTVIFLLAWTFYHLALNFQFPSPTKLPSSQSPVELYSNQTHDDLTHIFQHAIDSAKESITLLIYALTDPQIIQALQKKSESNVKVFIVCEARASPGISHRLPRATIVKRYGYGLMHQKILIIDNKQIWAGSANLTHSSLHIHGNLVMGIENPSLAEALTERARSMKEDGSFTALPHRETMAGPQNLELWVLPDDHLAIERMIETFRSAQKSIKVAMFTFTRQDFAEELIAAARRGVNVEVVMDRYSGKGASVKVVKLLEENGIPVRLSPDNKLMHHKFVYIDDNILINGSANWTKAAFNDNDDFFIVVSPLTPEQEVKMNKLWDILIKESENSQLQR
jgi:cardiolipin synthase